MPSAATGTLRHLGPRGFSLTAAGFIDTMADEVAKEATLAGRVAAVAVLICCSNTPATS
ncbi:hypothetical protein [Mycobacterium servetii]|uniref:Uncharacterized protein n=1 Tax=Mycobacterium servetii TaxID=3237418 RepID=A0ABV4CBU3_9MYCO